MKTKIEVVEEKEVKVNEVEKKKRVTKPKVEKPFEGVTKEEFKVFEENLVMYSKKEFNLLEARLYKGIRIRLEYDQILIDKRFDLLEDKIDELLKKVGDM